MDDIQLILCNKFKQLIRIITEEFDINEEELIKIYNKPITKKEGACCAKIKMGKRAGELCGKKISKNSLTNKYCGVHLKYESNETLEPVLQEDNITFEKNKWGYFEYGKTGLILSTEKKSIIGRIDADGVIKDLDKKDVDLCKMRDIKYIENYSREE